MLQNDETNIQFQRLAHGERPKAEGKSGLADVLLYFKPHILVLWEPASPETKPGQDMHLLKLTQDILSRRL